MIRTAQMTDTNKIISLFKLCFPGEDKFIDYFFKNIYNSQCCLLYLSDNKIVSCLQRLPYHIKSIGDVSYIFGACTDIAYRSKGIMAKLLEHSHALDKAENKAASILIPQQRSLFLYYAKSGYEPLFKLSRKTYKMQETSNDFSLDIMSVATSKDADQLLNLYNEQVTNYCYIQRDKEYILSQIHMFSTLDANVLCVKRDKKITGYAFIWEDKKPFITELYAKDDTALSSIINGILNKYNETHVQAISINGENEEPFGCIKYHSDKYITSQPLKMNLMFN